MLDRSHARCVHPLGALARLNTVRFLEGHFGLNVRRSPQLCSPVDAKRMLKFVRATCEAKGSNPSFQLSDTCLPIEGKQLLDYRNQLPIMCVIFNLHLSICYALNRRNHETKHGLVYMVSNINVGCAKFATFITSADTVFKAKVRK